MGALTIGNYYSRIYNVASHGVRHPAGGVAAVAARVEYLTLLLLAVRDPFRAVVPLVLEVLLHQVEGLHADLGFLERHIRRIELSRLSATAETHSREDVLAYFV